jgi:hypothetical protein
MAATRKRLLEPGVGLQVLLQSGPQALIKGNRLQAKKAI